MDKVNAAMQTLVREEIRKLPKEDLEAIVSAPTELIATVVDACRSAALDEARRALDDLAPTLCRLYTTDVTLPVTDTLVAIKADRKNIGVAIGLDDPIWFESNTLWYHERDSGANIRVYAYTDEGARVDTLRPSCCVYTRRWLGDVLLVVTVEDWTSEGTSIVYADYTDLLTSDQADNLIRHGSVPQFAQASLDRLFDRAAKAPHTD